jgi:hypothetical protein
MMEVMRMRMMYVSPSGGMIVLLNFEINSLHTCTPTPMEIDDAPHRSSRPPS